MNDAPVRIGLIGLGRMGRNHLRVLSMLKSAEVVFVHDADKEAVATLAAGVGVADDLGSALDSVDAVVIATPTVTHADYVRQAARRVANIFVEKPLAHSSAEARALAGLAGNLNVQVGFIERFNPAVQQVRRVLDRSTAVVSVDFTRTNKISDRIQDVDVITDLMIHDLDLAMYLNGPVRSVNAHGVSQGGMVEFASATLVHDNDRLSRITASRITEKKMRLIQATCRDMFVDCDLLRKEIVLSRQSEVTQPDGEPYTITAIEESLEVPPQEALIAELQAFLESCRGRGRNDLPGTKAGIAASELCDMVREAVAERP